MDGYKEELKTGYFITKDKKNYIKEKLVLEHAEQLAREFERGNKISQVRKFYEFCDKIRGSYFLKKDFNEVKVQLNELLNLTKYQLNKDKPAITRDFYNFIEINVKLAKQNEDDFIKGFMKFFESVIANY